MQRRVDPTSAARTSSRSAQGKWGSACVVCATAKAKCIKTDASSSCDRCKRLFKECTGQVHQPRKKRATKKTSRTSQLEERLNGLVDLLRASGELPGEKLGLRESRQGSAFAETGRDTTSEEPSPSISSPGEGDIIHIPSTWNAVCPPRCVCGSTPGDVRLPQVSDEDLLALYQSQLMPVFPFVVVAPETKVERFKAERPFLFAAIQMAATLTDIGSRRGQMYRLVQCVVEEIAISSVKSLDLVQSILVMLAWFHHHCMMHTQMVTLLHLAQAQMADLGLNKEPEVHERTHIMVLAPGKPRPRNSDEKRTLLGVWFLTSVMSATLLKVPSPRFTKYHRQCLLDVETSPEHDTDQLLVQLVEMQRLTEQIHNWIARDEDEADIPGLPTAPVAAYQGAFEAEIQRRRRSLPENLRNNQMLQLYFASATLRLYQPPPIEASVLKGLAESLTTIRPGTPSALDIFYRAKCALEGYFDIFFALPLDFYPVMPMATTADALWSITALARWAKVMGPGRSRAPTAPPDILTPQQVIWDPSALKPPRNAVFGRKAASVSSSRPDRDEAKHANIDAPQQGSTTVDDLSVRKANFPHSITDASQIQASAMHEVTDPDIACVVAKLKAQLHSQPELNLDIVGILVTLAQRFEQVHKDLLEASPSGSWRNDFWYLGAKKILIARARLEKWTEIISSGGVAAGQQKTTAASEHTGSDTDEAMRERSTSIQPQAQSQKAAAPTAQDQTPEAIRHWDGINAFQREVQAAVVESLPPDAFYEPDIYGGVWNDNLFDPLDPSLWLSDGDIWGGTLPEPMQETGRGF